MCLNGQCEASVHECEETGRRMKATCSACMQNTCTSHSCLADACNCMSQKWFNVHKIKLHLVYFTAVTEIQPLYGRNFFKLHLSN